MRFEGEHLLQGPREEVYSRLRDAQVLTAVMPGAQVLNQIDDTRYEGNFYIRSGPVSGQFAGKLEIVKEVPSQSLDMHIEFRGAPGKARGVLHLHLIEQDNSTILLKYNLEAELDGSLASVSERALQSQVKGMAREGFAALDRALLAVEQTGGDVIKKEMQTLPAEGASGQAGKLATWMKVPEIRMLVYIIPVGALVLVFSLVLTQCIP